MVILKDTRMNQDKFPFAQGGESFYCKKNTIIINLRFNIEFAIPIVRFPIYCNVTILKIVAKKMLFYTLKYSVKRHVLNTIISQEKLYQY